MVGCFGKGKEDNSATDQSLKNNENSAESGLNNNENADKLLNDQQQCPTYRPRFQILSRQPPQQQYGGMSPMYCCPPPPPPPMPNFCCPNPCGTDFSSVCQSRIPPTAPLPRQTETSRPPPGPPPLNRVMNVSQRFPCRPEPRSIGSGPQFTSGESYLPQPPPMPMMQPSQFSSQCMPQMPMGMNPMAMMMGQLPMMGMPQCQMPMCSFPWNPMAGASFFGGMPPMCQIPWNPNGQPINPQPAAPTTTMTVPNEPTGTNKVLNESSRIVQSTESVVVHKRTNRRHKKSKHHKKDGKGTPKKSKPSKKRKKKKHRRGKKDMVRAGEDDDEEDWEDDSDDEDDSSSTDSDQSQCTDPSSKSNHNMNCPQTTTIPSKKVCPSNNNNNRQVQCNEKSLTSIRPGLPIKVEQCVGESLSNSNLQVHSGRSCPACPLQNNRHSSGAKEKSNAANSTNNNHALHKKIHNSNNINQSNILYDCEPTTTNLASRAKEQVKGQTASKCVDDRPKKHKKGKSYPRDERDIFLAECSPPSLDLRHCGGSAYQLRSREQPQQRDYCIKEPYESQSLQSLQYDQKSPWMKTVGYRGR